MGQWGHQGGDTGQFNWPQGITIAPDGTIYVADSGNRRVQCFSAPGAFLSQWGSRGAGYGQFSRTSGIAVSTDGTVYVVDMFNDRVQAFGSSYPDTWRAEFFGNPHLTETPALIRQDMALAFDWGEEAPDEGLPEDGFSARWQRYVPFEEQAYQFLLEVDGGARLWVDGRLIVDAWQPQTAIFERLLSLSEGYHPVRLEYYDDGGAAKLALSWMGLAEGNIVHLPILTNHWTFAPDPPWVFGDRAIVVAESGLNMRSGPGPLFPRIKTLEPGSVVEVIGGLQEVDEYTWVEVRDETGVTGWVVTAYLQRMGES